MNRTWNWVPGSMLVLVAGAAVAIAAPQQKEPPQQQKEAQGAAVVEVQKSAEYGQYLTDGEGRALYLFMADKGKEGSTCYDACAKAWPPFMAKGQPKAGDPAVQEKQLSTIKRKDGSMQVAYGGWPLYYFIKDKGKGQTTGQDVKGFGAEWYLVSPKGEAIHGKMKY